MLIQYMNEDRSCFTIRIFPEYVLPWQSGAPVWYIYIWLKGKAKASLFDISVWQWWLYRLRFLSWRVICRWHSGFTCMAIAVAIMYVFLWWAVNCLLWAPVTVVPGISSGRVCRISGMAGICIHAVHWIWECVDSGDFVIIIYGAVLDCCLSGASVTYRWLSLNQLTIREVLAVRNRGGDFAFSNLSYLYSNLPFTSSRMADIFQSVW